MIRPRYRGSLPACAGPASADAVLTPGSSLPRKGPGHFPLAGRRALSVVRGCVSRPAPRLPSRSSRSNRHAPAIRRTRRAAIAAASRQRTVAEPDDPGHRRAQVGAILKRLHTAHEFQQNMALLDQRFRLVEIPQRIVVLAGNRIVLSPGAVSPAGQRSQTISECRPILIACH